MTELVNSGQSMMLILCDPPMDTHRTGCTQDTGQIQAPASMPCHLAKRVRGEMVRRDEIRRILIIERKFRGCSTDGRVEQCISRTCGHTEIGRFWA